MSNSLDLVNQQLAIQNGQHALSEVLQGLSPHDQQLILRQMAEAAAQNVGDTYDVTGQTHLSANQALAAKAHPFQEALVAKNLGALPKGAKPKGLIGNFKDNVGLVWTAWMISLLGAGAKELQPTLIKGLDPTKYQMKGGLFSKATLYNLFPSLTEGVKMNSQLDMFDGRTPQTVKGILGDVAIESTDELTRDTKWMSRQWANAGKFKKVFLWPLKKLGQGGEWITNKLYWIADKSDDIARNISTSGRYASGKQYLLTHLKPLGEKTLKIGGETRTLSTLARYGRRLISKLGHTRVFGFIKDIARNLGYTGKLGKAALIITAAFAVLRGAKNLIFGKGEHPYYGKQAQLNQTSFEYYS